jgi:AraC family transcriptional regulator
VSEFKVSVVDVAAKHLTGMKVRTSMTRAKEDCSAIWQNFCPKMTDIYSKEGYGVSVMLNEQEFDYWAAADAGNNPLPEGMGHIDIPAGKYAVCTVPNLDKCGEAYMFIYSTWLGSQTTWKPNMAAPCFELYPADWTPAAPFAVYVPVIG